MVGVLLAIWPCLFTSIWIQSSSRAVLWTSVAIRFNSLFLVKWFAKHLLFTIEVTFNVFWELNQPLTTFSCLPLTTLCMKVLFDRRLWHLKDIRIKTSLIGVNMYNLTRSILVEYKLAESTGYIKLKRCRYCFDLYLTFTLTCYLDLMSHLGTEDYHIKVMKIVIFAHMTLTLAQRPWYWNLT